MVANERIAKLVPEEGGTVMSKNVMYEAGNLPKVDAAMASHPYSGGAWSAVLQSFKVSESVGSLLVHFSDVHMECLFFSSTGLPKRRYLILISSVHFRPASNFTPPPQSLAKIE